MTVQHRSDVWGAGEVDGGKTLRFAGAQVPPEALKSHNSFLNFVICSCSTLSPTLTFRFCITVTRSARVKALLELTTSLPFLLFAAVPTTSSPLPHSTPFATSIPTCYVARSLLQSGELLRSPGTPSEKRLSGPPIYLEYCPGIGAQLYRFTQFWAARTHTIQCMINACISQTRPCQIASQIPMVSTWVLTPSSHMVSLSLRIKDFRHNSSSSITSVMVYPCTNRNLISEDLKWTTRTRHTHHETSLQQIRRRPRSRTASSMYLLTPKTQCINISNKCHRHLLSKVSTILLSNIATMTMLVPDQTHFKARIPQTITSLCHLNLAPP